jgi:drug/metabolite transporter (DMT)-like permease
VQTTRAALAATVIASGCWGLSSTVAQALFAHFAFPVIGLVAVRMLSAGVILLVLIGPRSRPALTPSFVSFSILGVAASQLTYLEAIQLSNAVTATLLQFLFLPMVATYEAITGAVILSPRWTATLGLAGFGTVLLVVHANVGSLGILVTPGGLVFGILSAVAGAYYSLAGRSLVRQHGPWTVTTWGFLVGGLVALPFGAASFGTYSPPTSLSGQLELAGLVGFIVVFGTLLGYGLYLFGLRHLPATEAGIASSFEPISSAVATYAFLGVVLTGLQYVGGAFIVLAVALLGLRRPVPANRDQGPRERTDVR